MERGHQMEEEARNYYSYLRDVEPQLVGFIRNGNKGASPDSILGSDGLLEIKTAFPHILVELLLKDQFPPEHRSQIQGQLWVAEREWADIIVYWPGMPSLVKRTYRDEVYIRTLASAVDQFNEELIGVVERIKRYAPLSNEVANAA
jgi:Trm5-related predicted tRNA methylase